MQLQRFLRQLELGANDDLGCSRWRRRAQVGDEVADGEVCLVSDGRDDWNLGTGNRACQAFVIKGEQVFEGTAASGHDDDVDLALAVEPADTGGDLERGAFA